MKRSLAQLVAVAVCIAAPVVAQEPDLTVVPPVPTDYQAKKKLHGFRELLRELSSAKAELGPSALARHVLAATGYEEALREENTAESDARLGNLEELVGAIDEYELELRKRGEEPTVEGYLERVSLIANTDTLEAGKTVSLMTVHSAKGLEFDIVFLTGMEETIFPYKGVDQTHGDSEAELDEERRLAYVAITRARKRLTITHTGVRQLFGRTRYLELSRFLQDIPDAVVSREGSTVSAYNGASRFGSTNYGSNRGASSWSRPAPARDSRPPLPPGTRIVERDYTDSSAWENEGVSVQPGSYVHHEKFGRGIVKAVEPGQSPTVVAWFKSVGTKRIKAEFLRFD